MHSGSSNHIHLQAFYLYAEIENIHRNPPAQTKNLPAKYVLLYKLLQDICLEQTRHITYSFANLFSRVDYLCKAFGLSQQDKYEIQTMRRNAKRTMDGEPASNLQEYLFDVRAIVRFVSLVFKSDIPETLQAELPTEGRRHPEWAERHIPYIRVSVESWNTDTIYASTDNENEPFIKIDYLHAGKGNDLTYLHELLQENMQLNLLNVTIDSQRTYHPDLIIVCPDYLIDISSLAACFREYGHHPLNYFINKIKPKANTAPILLGNLASQFLDDYINESEDKPVTYAKTINKYFAASALEFCTCHIEDTAQFHRQAQEQMANIRSIVKDILPANVPSFDKHKTWLEASFICEKLGLQGRVDMMQNDFTILIEQKSGKRNEYMHQHKEDHFVQMMLYQGVLKYNFWQEAKDLQPFLLYSKYPDGLMREHFAEPLFRESLHLRNRIVANEMAFGNGSIASVINELSTDLLKTRDVHPKLWNNYQKPQLQSIIDTLKNSSPLEKAYFQRFFTFLSKEQILCKTGGVREPGNSFAGLWHTPLSEKIEAGNILTKLKIISKKQSAPGKGYDLIELQMTEQGEDFLPNFRIGDIIILYAYHQEPDVREHILMKGNITELAAESLTVILRNGQQNKDLIGNETDTFAIEHDYSDTSQQNAMRGLHTFLSAPAERKELLLGTRTPARNKQVSLQGEYGRFNELMLKVKQASELFLLVGPPGTGKTSCALRYMVEEALKPANTSLLLLSYTNRAVDEICNMLVESGIAQNHPFIRIGNELSCDKRFRRYLLKNSIAEKAKLADIQNHITQTRIFVGTTTAINSRPYLFDLKHFSVAMIDEASQILEPDLIGILSAHQGKNNAIDKFILIGDYKQLPAIALQSEEDAAVTHPLLRAIGLTDCRNSLFERLYKQCPPEFRSVLHKQGRMHPAISDFPDNAFYYKEFLEPVPLPHQKEKFPYPENAVPQDHTDRLLTTRRMIFIPAETPADTSAYSDKTNQNEARIIASLLLHIYRLTSADFHPYKTVGVIVPYRNQITMIRKEISKLQIPALADISIDTVERYQGSQRDIIIYSFTIRNICQLNFLTANTFREDEFQIDRKLNVAITRARKQLIMVGNPSILGLNHTFYKLMEYIRIHNGYIETNTDSFCHDQFQIPEWTYGWDLLTSHYPVSENFADSFEAVIGREVPKEMPIYAQTDTRNRELTGYGRMNLDQGTSTYTALSARNRLYLYNYYYMRRTYAAAQSLFHIYRNILTERCLQTPGPTTFCDFSRETAASALAFADTFAKHLPTGFAYMGICQQEEITELTKRFFQTKPYAHIPQVYYPELSAIDSEEQRRRNQYAGTVIFNVSNLFGSISIPELQDIAAQINHWVTAYPRNQYILLYRDDAGTCANLHAYRTFCNYLCKIFHPLKEHMPFYEKFYYHTDGKNIPPASTYLYGILVSR